MKKILIPTDYSENANLATNYAMQFASLFNAEVILVHSYHLLVSDPNYVVDLDKNLEIEKLKMEEKKDQLHELFPNVRIETVVLFGPIVDVLDKICSEEEIDLIVMGTKGQTNAIEGLIGTVASHVISDIKTDVLVIPQNATYENITEVVLATDYHNLDNYNCFNNLIEIMSKTSASLAIVNIQKELNLFQIPSRTENRIEDLFGDFKVSKHFVQSENVEDSLEHFAKTHSANIIALTAPNYSFWQKIWHRSLTKKMALHSKVPVLVLKEK